MASSIIRNRAIVADSWQRIERADGDARPPIAGDGDVLVPVERWLAERDALAARAGRTGVWVDADFEPARLAGEYERFDLVAVHVPAFGDGRACSLARLIRDRYGYAGELRAFGEVRRDQMFFLWRCGFDAFELADGEDHEAALAALSDFSAVYQAAFDRGRPLARRASPGIGARPAVPA